MSHLLQIYIKKYKTVSKVGLNVGLNHKQTWSKLTELGLYQNQTSSERGHFWLHHHLN